MIILNPTLQLKYRNLIEFDVIARVQYISTTTCERTFFHLKHH